MAVAEAATGRLDNLAVLADGLHNLGDGVTYAVQSGNLLNEQVNTDVERLARRRRLSFGALAAGSAMVGATAAIEYISNTENYVSTASIGVAAASVAFNGLVSVKPLRTVWDRRHNQAGHSPAERDIIKHIALLDMPSSVLALVGSLMQKYAPGLHAEQVAAMVSSGIGAYAFRPSSKNLGHNHPH